MGENKCIFCKIANGEVPSSTVYEDDVFKVILDINPASAGHVLIISKQHYKNLLELPSDLAAKSIVLAKKLMIGITDILKCDGVNLVQNNEEAAGQTVFHFHVHIIPRYQDDKLRLNWTPGLLEEEIKVKMLTDIRNYM